MVFLKLRRFLLLLKRELNLSVSQGYGPLTAVLFYVLIPILFGFGVAADLALLGRIAGGVIWTCVLLTTLLSLESLFQSDYEDGTLELLWLTPFPMEYLFLVKTTAHWLMTALPVLFVTPFIAHVLALNLESLGLLMLTLLLGTPSLSLVGGLGACLTLGARRGGLLLALILLPLYIPVLIFSLSAIQAKFAGLSIQPHLLLLIAYFIAALPLTVYAGAASLRHAISS